MTLQRHGAIAHADGEIVHVPFVRAGNWVFGTGLRALGENGLPDPALTRADRPIGVAPRAQREAAAIFERMRGGLQALDSGLERVARLDQYYPQADYVDPYHVARKQALAGQVAPSTSVVVDGLLDVDARMDVQVMAATRASGHAIARAGEQRLNVPQTSGYAPCLRVGDMIFVAGQLARDASGGIAPQAMVPPGQQWNGTRIKLETAYLVEQRLLPALQAGGSSLDLVLKAQVYLSHGEDLPAFWQSWTQAFGGRVPPTTIVPVRHPAFGTTAATIEVNLVAAHGSAAQRVRDVRCDVELAGPEMLPARVFDGILFVAGLLPIEDGGLCAAARSVEAAPYYGDSVHAQMRDMLAKAERIFGAAGSDLSQVVRALHFHKDLTDFRRGFMAWDAGLRKQGLPFSAIDVGTELFLPGIDVILDLWGYVPA
jgi:enamine deaminase RidA (YjgF/YER057c/UK114 family)